MGHNYNKFYQQPKKSENSENKMEEVFDKVINDIVTVDPEVKVNEEGNMEMTVNVDAESFIENAEVLINEEVEQLLEEDVVEVEVTEEGSLVKGKLVNCSRLNVREAADKEAEVLCVIDKGSEVTITLEESTEDFYKVCTSSGVEGFCMKQFIEIK